jgi:hypothetical protein
MFVNLKINLVILSAAKDPCISPLPFTAVQLYSETTTALVRFHQK